MLRGHVIFGKDGNYRSFLTGCWAKCFPPAHACSLVQMPCALAKNSEAQHIMTFFDARKEVIQETSPAKPLHSVSTQRHDNQILPETDKFVFC